MFLGTSGTMSERRHHSITILRSTLPRVAFLLAFVIAMHQFVMATPAHEAIMPMMDHDMQVSAPMQDSHGCPHCPIHTIAICPAMQAALPHGSGVFLFFFAGALIAAALVLPMPTTPQQRTPLYAWLWPPRRRRAFLQIFLC